MSRARTCNCGRCKKCLHRARVTRYNNENKAKIKRNREFRESRNLDPNIDLMKFADHPCLVFYEQAVIAEPGDELLDCKAMVWLVERGFRQNV